MGNIYCATCGRNFRPSRADQIYCSAKCRSRRGRKPDLVLPIKRKWFDMILSGEKKEEYREVKPYWEARVDERFPYVYGADENGECSCHRSKVPREVIVRNGYGKDAPQATLLAHVEEREGKAEWGAEEGQVYFVFVIHEVVRVENYAGIDADDIEVD